MSSLTTKEWKEILKKVCNKKRMMGDDDVIGKSSPQKATHTSDSLAAAKRRRPEKEVIVDNNDTKHKMNESIHDSKSNKVSSAPPPVPILASTEQTIVPVTDDIADADFSNSFSIGNLIDAHFCKEKYQEKVKMLGLGGSCNIIQAHSIGSAVLARCMQREFDDLEAKKDDQLKQIAELENKLSESEKKLASMTRIKDEEINTLKKNLEAKKVAQIKHIAKLENRFSESEKKIASVIRIKDEQINTLKKNLEELNMEKSEGIKREEELMEENCKFKVKLEMQENTHKLSAEKLKVEIEELKAGFNKAVNQVLSSLP